jgi:hypothetical protein
MKVSHLFEMATSSQFNSGWLKSTKAKELVKAFKAGEETYEFENGRTFKMTSKVTSTQLTKGTIIFASYNSTNQGARIYEVLGFTVTTKKYGESGVKYDSIKDVFKAAGVSSLKALEDAEGKNEYGMRTYLVVKDLEDGDEGPWFYLYKGG